MITYTNSSHRFFHLYLIDFNSTKFVLKLAVEKEQVAIIYISALKMEGKNLACHIPNISFSAPMTLKGSQVIS